MRNLYILLVVILFSVGCNTYKKAQKNIYKGNFDTALSDMVKKYQKANISQKDINRWGKLFLDAYIKAKKHNADYIVNAKLMPEGIEKQRRILRGYQTLQKRNKLVRSIMPIQYKGQEMNLGDENYFNEITAAKKALADELFNEAEALMATFDKFNARIAYGHYREAKSFNPNLEDIDAKTNLAYNRGLSHTLVKVNNDAFVFMPRFLERDMTNFNAYGVESFWNILHSNADRPTNEYDYVLELNFTHIGVRPYRETVDRYVVTKEIDLKIKDTSKMKKKETIECTVTEFRQYKEAAINSEIVLMDNTGRTLHRESPVISNHIVDHTWVKLSGNRKALDRSFLRNCAYEPIRVPTDEMMLIGCSEELKGRFRGFIHQRVVDL